MPFIDAISKYSVIITSLIWVFCIAFIWIVTYRFNQIFLDSFSYSAYANLIFLPAAVKVFAILVARWNGFWGLFIGGLYVNYTNPEIDFFYAIYLSLTLGLGPLVALYLANYTHEIDTDLKTITPYSLLWFVVLSAILSGIFHGIYLYLAGIDSSGILIQSLVIFVGDILGCLIILIISAKVFKLLEHLKTNLLP
jgi:hypothetical protein